MIIPIEVQVVILEVRIDELEAKVKKLENWLTLVSCATRTLYEVEEKEVVEPNPGAKAPKEGEHSL